MEACHSVRGNVVALLENAEREYRDFGHGGFPYQEESKQDEAEEDEADDFGRAPGGQVARADLKTVQEADGTANNEDETGPIQAADALDEGNLLDVDLEEKEDEHQGNSIYWQIDVN